MKKHLSVPPKSATAASSSLTSVDMTLSQSSCHMDSTELRNIAMLSGNDAVTANRGVCKSSSLPRGRKEEGPVSISG
jgi:hypothetical protein